MSQLVSVSRDSVREAIAAQDQAEGESAESSQPDNLETHSDVGKELQLKVLEVNRGRNRAILSERQAIQEDREKKKARLIQELSVGEVRRGTVTGLSSFGAFVDLGGADGLIHISELSWNTINSPEEVLTVGQEIDVYVLRVDHENRKIGLSLKRLQQEPWETINDRYQVGDLVDATVTKVTDFGAFARVEGSVEGLIHISGADAQDHQPSTGRREGGRPRQDSHPADRAGKAPHGTEPQAGQRPGDVGPAIAVCTPPLR